MRVPDLLDLARRSLLLPAARHSPSEILALMEQSRDTIIKQIELFLLRPNIRSVTRRLSFRNQWPWDAFGQFGFVDTSVGNYSFANNDSDLYRPLRVAMRITIRADIPLVYLSISHFMIDGHLAMNIARHPTLQDLSFTGCTTSDGLEALVIGGAFQRLPPSNSRTLRVHLMNNQNIDMAWCALAICRNPQVFSIPRSRRYSGFLVPQLDMEQLLVGAFAHVQRLQLTHVPSSLVGLTDWFTTVHAAGHQLRLTHLKLDSPLAMHEPAMLDILVAINHSPILKR